MKCILDVSAHCTLEKTDASTCFHCILSGTDGLLRSLLEALEKAVMPLEKATRVIGILEVLMESNLRNVAWMKLYMPEYYEAQTKALYEHQQTVRGELEKLRERMQGDKLGYRA